MAKNKWFKHYNNAMKGDTLQTFIASQDYECVVLFWMLLEIVSRQENEEKTGEATVEMAFLAREMNMKPSKIRRLLARFSSVSLSWNLRETNEKISYLVPNWLELQENRGGKRESNDPPKNDQNTTEVRSKKKEVRIKENTKPNGLVQKKAAATFEFESAEDFKKFLAPSLVSEMKNAYSDAYVESEIKAAFLWSMSKKITKRTETGWNQFLNGWLKRGWDKYISSNHQSPVNPSIASKGGSQRYKDQRMESEEDFFKKASDDLLEAYAKKFDKKEDFE